MTDRLTRKDIKREVQHDQFAENVQRSIEYVYGNLRTILMAAGGVALVVVLAVVWSLWQQSRQRQGVEELAYAQRVFDAPVGVETPAPEDPDSPSFADEDSRRVRAKVLFEEVASTYGGDLEEVAQLYLARIAVADGDLETARELWQGLAGDEDAVAQEARLNLIAVDRAHGRSEEAARELEALLADSDPALPRDVVMFELAETYEQMDRQEDAASLYQQLLDEFPDSGYRDVAQQRIGVPASVAGLTPQGFSGI